MKKPLTTNPIYGYENGLKLTYNKVEFQNFPGRTPGPSTYKGGEGTGELGRRGKRRPEEI